MGLYEREYYREPEGQMSFRMDGQSATMLLVYANVAIFLVDFLLQLKLINTFGVHNDTLFKPYLWFQYLTYGFLHSIEDPWHIVMNMFVLWMFGRMVEDRYGKAEFLKIYFISIVLCGLAWNLVTIATLGRNQPAVMVGASGAISTILTLFICLYPRVTIYVSFILPVPAWVAGLVLLLLNLFGTDQDVAYSAHLAGAGLGVLYFFSGMRLGSFTPSKFTWPKWSFRKKPRLRVHTEEEDYDPYNDSDEEAERILDKVRTSGMDSLTEAERRKLEAYSRRMRQKLS